MYPQELTKPMIEELTNNGFSVMELDIKEIYHLVGHSN